MIAGSLVEGIWEGLFGREGLVYGLMEDAIVALEEAMFGRRVSPTRSTGEGAGFGPKPEHQSSSGSTHGGGGGGFGGGIPEIPKRGAGFGGGMSTEGHDGKTGGIHITQNIYSQAMTAADIMEEALFRQREAILFGV